jgi:hypothetical protein
MAYDKVRAIGASIASTMAGDSRRAGARCPTTVHKVALWWWTYDTSGLSQISRPSSGCCGPCDGAPWTHRSHLPTSDVPHCITRLRMHCGLPSCPRGRRIQLTVSASVLAGSHVASHPFSSPGFGRSPTSAGHAMGTPGAHCLQGRLISQRCRGRSGPMPLLVARREPEHVARLDLLSVSRRDPGPPAGPCAPSP